jgi:hypothetical protein
MATGAFGHCRPVAELTAQGTVLAEAGDHVGESAVRTHQHARVCRVVEVLIGLAAVGEGAVAGGALAADAVVAAESAVVGVGGVDVLSEGTGGAADGVSYGEVILRGGDVAAFEAVVARVVETGQAGRIAGSAKVVGGISVESILTLYRYC